MLRECSELRCSRIPLNTICTSTTNFEFLPPCVCVAAACPCDGRFAILKLAYNGGENVSKGSKMSQMSKQELSQLASQFAASLMREEKSNEDVIEALLDEGLAIHEAEFIVEHLLKIRADNKRREARTYLGKMAAILVVSFFLGMLFNGIWPPFGYVLMLGGFILCYGQLRHYNRLMEEAQSIQKSMPKRIVF
jgi:hypothetical protein